MDDGLKQRIVGAFVLVAIGVVFIPVFFDRERIEPVNRHSQIPPAPHIEPIDIEPAVAPPIEEDAESGTTMYLPDAEADVDESPSLPTPGLAENGTPRSWVLQMASYRFEAHAKQKRDELLQMGYNAYIREIYAGNGKMYRLFVGPNLQKKKIIDAKKVLDKQFGVDSIVLKFQP